MSFSWWEMNSWMKHILSKKIFFYIECLCRTICFLCRKKPSKIHFPQSKLISLFFFAESISFIPHTCYSGTTLCRPIAADCEEYYRRQSCCCERHVLRLCEYSLSVVLAGTPFENTYIFHWKIFQKSMCRSKTYSPLMGLATLYNT